MEWLENGILEYIKNNTHVDSVDIVHYFRLRADITLNALSTLIESKKVKRIENGLNCYYKEINNDKNN